jgi:hypothetical protein
LVVTIEETTNASETGSQEDTDIPDKCLWPSLAGQLHAVLQGSIAEL